MELSARQKKVADSLLQKHNEKTIYVNLASGHMHFKRNNALAGARKPEDLVEYDGKKASLLAPQAPNGEDPPAPPAPKGESGAPPAPKGETEDVFTAEMAKELGLPEDADVIGKTKEEILADVAKELPDLKVQKNWKVETIVRKVLEFVEKQGAAESDPPAPPAPKGESGAQGASENETENQKR